MSSQEIDENSNPIDKSGKFFVGRDEELQKYLALLEKVPPPWMIAIKGVAGIGKTALLEKMMEYTPEDTAGVIFFNFDTLQENIDALDEPLQFLSLFTQKIQDKHYCDSEAISEFKILLAKYRNELASFVKQLYEDIDDKIGENVQAPLLKEQEKQRQEAQVHRQYLALQKRISVSELALLSFCKMLDTFNKSRLIIILDGCEWLTEPLGKEVGQWLMEIFFPRLRMYCSFPCYTVVAGRQFPEALNDRLDNQKKAYKTWEMPFLSEEEVKSYLKQKNVRNDKLLEQAHTMTHGHALCMTIIGELADKSDSGMSDKDFDLQVFEREFDAEVFTNLVQRRILSKLDAPLRDIVQYSALVRRYQEPLLKAVFTDIPLNKIPSWFKKLSTYSFMEADAFHGLLRKVLILDLHKDPIKQKRAKDYHKKIRDYISDVLKEKGSPEWHYHNIAYDEEKGIAEWKKAIEHERKTGSYSMLARQLLEVVKDETTVLELPKSKRIRDEELALFESSVPANEVYKAENQERAREISRDVNAPEERRNRAAILLMPSKVPERLLGEANIGVGGPPNTSSPPPTFSNRLKRYAVPALLVLLLLLLLLVPIGYVLYTHQQNAIASFCNGANVGYVASDTNVVTAANGEHIGLSDGTFAFDTNRPGGHGDLKLQATSKLKACDNSGATSLWNQAATLDTSDAETLIYRENQRVMSSGRPYITLVVGTTLTGDSSSVATGRDNLQGAYVAQKTFNDGFKLPGGVQVRLLIANSGRQSKDAAMVATQIVDAAKKDKSIVGVMGWPSSSNVLEAVHILAQAHIPLISPTASSDKLTGISPYFFRVAPSDNSQAKVGAQYAQQVLHAKKVALFVDPQNVDSQALAQDFKARFMANSPDNSVIAENYTVGRPDQLPVLLKDAFAQKVDMVYFSGSAADVSVILINLPTSGPFAHIQVMGGASLYQVGTGTYSPTARPGFNRLHFTAFAYPDEWHFIAPNEQSPGFFKIYKQIFDPTSSHSGNPYGYSRADNDTLLSYDATLALLQGSSNVNLQKGHTFTGDDVRQGLSGITGANAIQGVSGRLSFGSDGDPLNKTVVMLFVNPDGFIQIEQAQGCFLVNHCSTS